MPTSDIHYYGIRHHGPGSTKRLLASLEQARPSMVLIEGPADCSELLPLLAHPQMKPPIALLAYAADEPACSFYYPFAEFSPEYQAARWAVANKVPLAFIDLPVNFQLAQMLLARKIENENDAQDVEENKLTDRRLPSHLPDENTGSDMTRDPIGTLARCARYEDGEAWWNDLIEHNGCNENNSDVFATVELAMTELRNQVEEHDTRELQREAFMRIEISKMAKSHEGSIAVVCGAWHVPALKENHTLKSDREILKALPAKLTKSKVKFTWVPWTSPRLASLSGYGAGVDAPMWYQHLWHERDNKNTLEIWLAKITLLLRKNGHVISTASIIEAVRLSTSLAVIRDRPAPGFEEIREAVIACLCFGEEIVWKEAETVILLGNLVGEIPDDAPLVPLLEDLQRLQKKKQTQTRIAPKGAICGSAFRHGTRKINPIASFKYFRSALGSDNRFWKKPGHLSRTLDVKLAT